MVDGGPTNAPARDVGVGDNDGDGVRDFPPSLSSSTRAPAVADSASAVAAGVAVDAARGGAAAAAAAAAAAVRGAQPSRKTRSVPTRASYASGVTSVASDRRSFNTYGDPSGHGDIFREGGYVRACVSQYSTFR